MSSPPPHEACLRRDLLVRSIAFAAAVALLAGPRATAAGPAGEPLVFAAASLKEALEQAASQWTARSGVRVRFSFAGSHVLARQLEQGAPADVFISADQAWMDHVVAQGLVAKSSVFDLAGNRLVLVGPANTTLQLALVRGVDLGSALAGGRLAVADVRAVPAGRYARAALESLGAWAAVEPRLAMTENVRAALALVARGEAPLGVVYASDARAEPRVRVIDTFPAGSHPPVRYPAGLVAARDGRDQAHARAFLAFLRSPVAMPLFAAHGFQAPAD